MKCVNIFLVVVFLAMLVDKLDASCGSMAKEPPGADQPCVTPAGNLAVGESRNSYTDCKSYECGVYGISYCGIGYNGGVFSVDGCVQQNLDNCCFQFVNASDPSDICEEKQCPYDYSD